MPRPPAGLLSVELSNGLRLVEGRKLAAFTKAEEVAAGKDKVVPVFLADRLGEQGATHVFADVFAEKVVVDDRLLSGQNPASAAGAAKEMERLFAQRLSIWKRPRSNTRRRPCGLRRTPRKKDAAEAEQYRNWRPLMRSGCQGQLGRSDND